MRELKFRIWDKKSKIMIPINHDRQVKIRENHWQVVDIKIGVQSHSSWDNNSILMQYTGLKDKDGKEIYEGDIIKYKYYFDYGQSGEYKSFTRCVSWDDMYCGFSPMYATGEYEFPRNRIEVIGNIYENPELLKKENQNETKTKLTQKE